MKTYDRVEAQFHAFFDLATRWRLVVRFTLRPLYHQGKSPWYQLDRRLGAHQSHSGRGGEEENSQPPPGELHKLYSLPNIMRVIQSRRMSWAGRVERRGDEKYTNFLLENKSWRPLRRSRCRLKEKLDT